MVFLILHLNDFIEFFYGKLLDVCIRREVFIQLTVYCNIAVVMSQYVRQPIYFFPTWLAGLSLCIYMIKQQKNVNVTFKTWHYVLGWDAEFIFTPCLSCIWAHSWCWSYASCIREGTEPTTFFLLYETTVLTTAPPSCQQFCMQATCKCIS